MFKTQNLYQNDEKWQNVKLGNSSITIGKWGCLLTSVTMMLNGIGHKETPESVNDKMKQVGGFDGALFIPSLLPYVWANCGWRAMQDCKSYPAPIADIDAALNAGKPVILQVDWSKEVDVQTHFVLVKEKKGNDYVIYDPYKYGGDSPDKEVLLTQRYKYNGARLETEISAVLWFDAYGVAEPPKATKVPVPAEKYILYAMEDDLALRAEPSFSGYLWKRMLMGTELICLEPKAAARAKLGRNGEWIHVQHPDGDQGYAAAWYLSDTKGTPAASSVTTSPVASGTSTSTKALPPGALLFVPTDTIAFRTKPVKSDQTLIRYIPVNEQLFSIEPAQEAIRKVGVDEEWLKVRDSSGREGYVAAWLVQYASGSTVQKPAATVMSSNGGPLKVRATAEAIALRSKPVISDATLIKRLPLGTELTVLEPNAEAKIGSNNQWLNVKDPSGTEGYVAAWFVGR